MHTAAFPEILYCVQLPHLALKPGNRSVTLQVALGTFGPAHRSLLCKRSCNLFPLTCIWRLLSVYSLQSSRDQPVGTRGQDRTPRLHPPWSSHTLYCCALWSTPGPWSLWSYGWIFCCSLRTSRESRGERAALRSVPFYQHLASKTASASLRLQILVSQKAVTPSVLPAWYLGKILR